MRLAVMVVLCASFAMAQADAPQPLKKGDWELGVWTAGAFGVPGGVEHVHTWSTGFRVGKVLSGERGVGFLRGNLEWAADVVPVELVFQPTPAGRITTYSFGLDPLIMKWNFSGGRRVKPFFEMGGGLLFSADEVPLTTSKVNFVPLVGFGVHLFTRERRAITLTAKYHHISNAGMATPNPGINTIQFGVGYSWFK